jgi:hypothetical protein
MVNPDTIDGPTWTPARLVVGEGGPHLETDTVGRVHADFLGGRHFQLLQGGRVRRIGWQSGRDTALRQLMLEGLPAEPPPVLTGLALRLFRL